MRRLAVAVVLVVVSGACGVGGGAEGPATTEATLPVMTLRAEAPATSSTSAPPSTAPASSATTVAVEKAAVLRVDPARLDVASEVWGDYDRDLFVHWSDLDGDGCDTRQEILIRDSAVDPAMHPERVCRVVAGRWWSSYDDWWTDDPADLHIDHLVPLAEAWESGARLWSDEEREAFANDSDGLVAVSAASNVSKGASDPAGWLPPNEDVWCTYAAVWIEVKAAWGLTADQAEIDALSAVAIACNRP